MARLEVDGNKSIYYEDLGGDGRAMVLIHGWGMDNRCWDGVILRSEEHTSELQSHS